eukprot:scaffold317144_cov21-Tisochrysis_lutea.AAC.1
MFWSDEVNSRGAWQSGHPLRTGGKELGGVPRAIGIVCNNRGVAGGHATLCDGAHGLHQPAVQRHQACEPDEQPVRHSWQAPPARAVRGVSVCVSVYVARASACSNSPPKKDLRSAAQTGRVYDCENPL